MKTWLRISIIFLTVGGGFCGFAATWQVLVNALKSAPHNPTDIFLLVVFLALYGFVTIAGLVFSQNQRKILPILISFGLQIPWISSPFLSFRFTGGLHATIGIVGGGFGGGVSLGSDWQCSLFQQAPWGVGVNLFALFMFILLAHSACASKQRFDASTNQASQ